MKDIFSTEEKMAAPTLSHEINETRILVVEDEAIIAMDIKGILNKMGYFDSQIVDSGEESVRKVAAERPDLVLMDIKLKGEMDGIEAAKLILKQYNVPVVYITAYGDEATLKRVNGTNRFGYITKPFEEADLRSTIQEALVKASN